MRRCAVRAGGGPLRGTVAVPGDKSIGHRALLLNAMAEGSALVRDLPAGADVRTSLAAIRALGVAAEGDGDTIALIGGGRSFADGLTATIDCANSGTTMRLLAGMVAGCASTITLDGDASLRRRPMERVAAPLRAMGADVSTTGTGTPPMVVRGGRIDGVTWAMPVASAQVKSAVLLAGLRARGTTIVREPLPTRDHTERMLAAMRVPIEQREEGIAVAGGQVPQALDVVVPGDPSSAMFFVVAAACVPGSDVVIDGVCLNPGRIGALEVLRRMGADVAVTVSPDQQGGEPVGRIRARGSRLRGTSIVAAEVPGLIDELPILLVAAATADGATEVRGAEELRAKESDRLAAMGQLASMGVRVETFADGMRVEGRAERPLEATTVRTEGDHRVAMAFAIAGLRASDGVVLDDAECAAVSFPEFFDRLAALGVEVR